MIEKDWRDRVCRVHPSPEMGDCQIVNSDAFMMMKEHYPDLILVGGEVKLDRKVTLVDEMGSVVETDEITHVWMEKDGEVIDFARDILRPAKLVGYTGEGVLDKDCLEIETYEDYKLRGGKAI